MATPSLTGRARGGGYGRPVTPTMHGASIRACTQKIAIGDSDLIMSPLAHFADSTRTCREVREVPIAVLSRCSNMQPHDRETKGPPTEVRSKETKGRQEMADDSMMRDLFDRWELVWHE